MGKGTKQFTFVPDFDFGFKSSTPSVVFPKKKKQVFEIGEGLGDRAEARPGPTRARAGLPLTPSTRFAQARQPQISKREIAERAVRRKPPIRTRGEKLSEERAKIAELEPDPKKLRQVAKDTVLAITRAPGRALASVGIGAAAPILEIIKKDRVRAELKPETRFQKMIFGEQPIVGMFDRVEDASTEIKSTLVSLGADEKTATGSALLLAPMFVAGLTGLDLTPFGGGKQTVSKVASTRNVDEITKLISPVLKTKKPKEIRIVAEELAQHTNKDSIKNILLEAASTPKIVAQKFRSDKLRLSDDQLLALNQRLDVLGLDTRHVVSVKDMEKAAVELGTDVDSLLKIKAGDLINRDEALALKNTINQNMQFVSEAEKRIAANPNVADTLLPRIEAAEQQVDQAVSKLLKGGTEAGRTLVAFKQLAKETLDPAVWLVKAQRELGEKPMDNEMRAAITELIEQKDINGLAMFVSLLRKSSTADKATTLWKAGLLTAPTTHFANVAGNLTMSTLMTANDIVASSLDAVAALATGKRTTAFSPRTVAAKIKGLKKGTIEAKQFFKSGVFPKDLLKKYDIAQQVNFKNKFLDKYTKTIFRSLAAEDIVFRQAAISEAMEKQALVIAKNEGLKGKAVRARVGELLTEPTNEMIRGAIDAAEFATFQNKNALANLISGGRGTLRGSIKARQAAGEPTVGLQLTLGSTELVAPFTQTPTNIAARIADFSPLGFVKTIVKQIDPTTRGQKVLVDDLSKAITGTGIIGLGMLLGQKGLMTGNLPTSPSERADFFAEGKQPNSILINGQWHQLSRVSPLGNLLSLGAEFNELKKEKQGTDLVAGTFFSGLKGLTEQTFLKGLAGGLKALTEPERSGARFAQQSIASTIPVVIGKVTRIIDPTLRNPEGILETIKTKIPFLSKQVTPRLDIFGNKIKAAGGRAAIVDPFSRSELKNEPVIKEAKRLDTTIGFPSRRMFNDKLSNAEYTIFQAVNGKITKAALEQLIENKGYKKLPEKEKIKKYKNLISKVRDRSRDKMYPLIITARYDLPKETNPEVLTEVMAQLNKKDSFEKLPDEKKKKVVQAFMEKVSEQIKK